MEAWQKISELIRLHLTTCHKPTLQAVIFVTSLLCYIINIVMQRLGDFEQIEIMTLAY